MNFIIHRAAPFDGDKRKKLPPFGWVIYLRLLALDGVSLLLGRDSSWSNDSDTDLSHLYAWTFFKRRNVFFSFINSS